MFPLLNPQAVPLSADAIGAALAADVRLALAMVSQLPEVVADGEAAEIVAAALRAVPTRDAPVVGVRRVHAPPGRGYAEFDAYFEVVRVDGEPTRTLLRSTLLAYAAVLRDKDAAGTSLTEEEWQTLRGAFDALCAFLRGTVRVQTHDRARDGVHRTPVLADEAGAAGRLRHPLPRWRTGHHVFFVLIQGLVMAFNCFDRAMAARDPQTAGETLDLATALMRGSAMALRFASDFPPEDYERIVRPSMSPPHVSPGFSGLMSVDHKHMLTVIRQLRPVFADMPPSLAAQHRRYLAAVEAAYDAHKFVCEKFKGDAQPSLRQPADADRPAVEVLEQLKRNRLRSMVPKRTGRTRARRIGLDVA